MNQCKAKQFQYKQKFFTAGPSKSNDDKQQIVGADSTTKENSTIIEE